MKNKKYYTILMVLSCGIIVLMPFIRNVMKSSLSVKTQEYFNYFQILLLVSVSIILFLYAMKTNRVKQFLFYLLIFGLLSVFFFFVFK